MDHDSQPAYRNKPI